MSAKEGPAREGGIGRRTALKVIAAGAAGAAAAGCDLQPAKSPHEELSGFAPLPRGNPLAKGTLTDPDLLNPVTPWSGVLGEEELRQVGALADLVIPKDDRSPAASAVGVVEYVNEFVSAPAHAEQLTRLRAGLAWLNREASRRFAAENFAELGQAESAEILDEICFEPDAAPERKEQARFFDAFRDMVATGFWTTEEGMKDLGYVGNVPLPSFDGPPRSVLEQLGLAEEDL